MPLRSSTIWKLGSRTRESTRSSSRVPTVPTSVSHRGPFVAQADETESRSLNVRLGYKTDKEKAGFVHMLNGTLCATERALCCLVENYQTAEVRLRPRNRYDMANGTRVSGYPKLCNLTWKAEISFPSLPSCLKAPPARRRSSGSSGYSRYGDRPDASDHTHAHDA